METEFKVGDIVEVVHPQDGAHLYKGTKWEVEDAVSKYEESFLILKDHPHNNWDEEDGWHVSRFKKVNSDSKEEPVILAPDYSTNHYDSYYHLTEQDIKEGKIRVDAYWVAKQWRTGSRDDSGALWHSLKTIARFGEKNSVEREIKALYNQAKALGRIYGVNLED